MCGPPTADVLALGGSEMAMEMAAIENKAARRLEIGVEVGQR